MTTRARQPQLGVPPPPYTPVNEHYQQWSIGNIGRRAALSVAVISTTLGNWPAKAPSVVPYGFHNQSHRYSPAKRSVALLRGPIWPAQVVPSSPVVTPTPSEWWRTQWTDPPKAAKRSVKLLGNDFLQGLRPPEREYINGWFAQWEDAPAYNVDQFLYLTDEFGEYIYTESDELIELEPSPRAYRIPQITRRSYTTLGGPVWSPRQPLGIVYGFSDQIHRYEPAKRSGTLLQGFGWPGYGYFFQVPPTATPSDLWFTRWQEQPRERLRSIALRQSSWAAWDPQFVIQITPPTPLEGVTFTFGVKSGATAIPGTKRGATLITRLKPRNS